jgi:nucleotide-binding universal stress UspA family protein
MKKILVPCDFSKPAINAFRVALGMAAKVKAAIHLINVIELPVLHDTVLMPVLNFEAALLEEMKEKTDKKFQKLVEKYETDGVKVVYKLDFGSPFKTIVEYAESQSIDLIVMGSHGASGLREFVVGSNAQKIIRRSAVPVMIVKDFFKGAVKNIVFPNTLDTEFQEDLLMKVKALQEFFKATLHVVFINTPLNFTSDDITLTKLSAFAKRFSLKNYTLNIFNHASGEEGISLFAERVKADMIAMGTHGRKGIAHLVNGSLAENVANHSTKPIWTYSLKNESAPVKA